MHWYWEERTCPSLPVVDDESATQVNTKCVGVGEDHGVHPGDSRDDGPVPLSREAAGRKSKNKEKERDEEEEEEEEENEKRLTMKG